MQESKYLTERSCRIAKKSTSSSRKVRNL